MLKYIINIYVESNEVSNLGDYSERVYGVDSTLV